MIIKLFNVTIHMKKVKIFWIQFLLKEEVNIKIYCIEFLIFYKNKFKLIKDSEIKKNGLIL
jgi:hypothetical protein